AGRPARTSAVTAGIAAAEPAVGDERLEDELAGGRGVAGRVVAGEAELADDVEEGRHGAEALERRSARGGVPELEHAATFEVIHDILELRGHGFSAPRLEGVAGGAGDEFARDAIGTDELALVLEFELAGDGRKRGVDVGG